MAAKFLTIALVVVQMQLAANSPLRPRRSPRELQPLLISPHPLQHNYYLRNNIPLLPPISLTQLYLQKLHVISANNNLAHGNLQHLVTKDNVKIPVITQTVQNTANYTHSSLLPLLIPIHNIVSTGNHLVPVHDLSVIPLQGNKIEKAQYRTVDKKEEENEQSSNQYRNFYGGYGNGLFFGGHGSGHGFYAYGK